MSTETVPLCGEAVLQPIRGHRGVLCGYHVTLRHGGRVYTVAKAACDPESGPKVRAALLARAGETLGALCGGVALTPWDAGDWK